jgi:hypothetical protein
VFYFLLRWLALLIIFGFVDEDLVQCMNEVHTQKLKAHDGRQRKARPEDKLGTRHVTSEPKKQREAAGFAARLSAQHDAKWWALDVGPLWYSRYVMNPQLS